MATKSNFKVIIAGGGVAGLTLAIMLEKFDIDYVLLEAHAEIAPAIGASIGLLANGLRILDQLGCYEAIEKAASQRIHVSRNRNAQGKAIFSLSDSHGKLIRRHGYAFLFFDRQWLLQILYDHLRLKDRVLLNKKVDKVDLLTDGVKVTTCDGAAYTGALLIGADGIHSRVREEMFRIGNQIQPGYFPPGEQDRVPCKYRCLFGISQRLAEYDNGELNYVRAKDYTQLLISGPNDRLYWFIFDRLPEIKYGNDIPRYNKEDEAEFVEKFRNVPTTEKLTFGDIYSKTISSTLTPIHEVVYEKWFFKRILVFGDSAHKPNPLGGQGGNSAIESAAELMNQILRARDARSEGLNNLTEPEIEDILRKMQATRHDRAKMMIAEAHRQQKISAYENPLLSAIALRAIPPILGDELLLDTLSGPIVDTVRLDYLPLPARSVGTSIPFTDALPAKPVSKSTSWIVSGAYAGGMAALIWLAGKTLRLPVAELTGWGVKGLINRPWAGSEGGKYLLKMLVSFFSHPVIGEDPSHKVHTIYFLAALASPVLMYTVDGYRRGNQRSLLSLPSIFLGLMQIKGIARIAPLHAILTALQPAMIPYNRGVPTDVAKALLPAVTLGYAIPTALMLAPTPNMGSWQDWTALWQFCPVFVPALTSLVSTGLRWRKRRCGPKPAEEKKSQQHAYPDHKPAEDMPVLRSTYAGVFAVQAAAHAAVLAYSWSHPSISIYNMFFGVPNPLSPRWDLPNTASKVSAFLKYDMLISCTAGVAGNLYSVWDLRRLGYIHTCDAIKAAIGVIVGQVVVGPGATWMGLSYWREGVLAETGRL